MLTGKQHLPPLMLTLVSFSRIAFVVALNVISGGMQERQFSSDQLCCLATIRTAILWLPAMVAAMATALLLNALSIEC